MCSPWALEVHRTGHKGLRCSFGLHVDSEFEICFASTQGLHSSSFSGFIFRIL